VGNTRPPGSTIQSEILEKLWRGLDPDCLLTPQNAINFIKISSPHKNQ
jgi:hypothetical protein